MITENLPQINPLDVNERKVGKMTRDDGTVCFFEGGFSDEPMDVELTGYLNSIFEEMEKLKKDEVELS